ncbi:hypothetical protein LSH36_192g01012 [Paralvinella palmiformis]|uniref:Exonuclease 3'-5' domain-containing protein 2 n=1 Tax=Paralvinella palmiformis TaxID=53620 RepID=A0AAD9JQM9_9ANNE|nr:hypothetical protein LSH36_192g01012 [Paralvinella palmiformis]
MIATSTRSAMKEYEKTEKHVIGSDCLAGDIVQVSKLRHKDGKGSFVAGGYLMFRLWWNIYRSSKFKIIPTVIHVIRNSAQWNAVYPTIRNELGVCKLLGFDCEWVSGSSQKRPVALLQLATPYGTCVLIQMLQMDTIPATLSELLAEKLIIKAGVGCLGDAQKLLKDHSLHVQGCVDLRHLAVRARLNPNGLGLQALTKDILDADLNKDISLRAGNWEREALTKDQITYAALDALVGAKVFLVLVSKKLGHSVYSQDQPITDEKNWVKVQSMCQGIIDVPFSQNSSHEIHSRPRVSSKANPKTASQATRAYKMRERPLYHNCQLWAPDGQMLCTCDIQKAQWYLDKGLGEKVGDDPLTVQLTFEPSGRPMNEMNYYLQVKDNQCVVCGKRDSYIRKNVVPREYRKYFPTLLKEHRSHDVVLMCSSCHRVSGLHDVGLKQHLTVKCNAGRDTVKFKAESGLQKVKSAAKALLNTSAKIPANRIEELRNIIKLYYGVSNITEELLGEAVNIDIRLPNDAYEPHGHLVVKYYIEHEGLMALEKLWRQHFIDTMKPEYLPELWSVDHSHDELKDMNRILRDAIRV